MIKILMGGSPCTKWSIARRDGRETTPAGIGWELFRNYAIAKEKFQPDFFLYENNQSIAQEIKTQISAELGAQIKEIDSALFSGQQRKRIYVCNWDAELPEGCETVLGDVLEDEVDEKYWYDRKLEYLGDDKRVCAKIDIKGLDVTKRVYNPKFKSPTLTTCGGGHRYPKVLINGRARKLTPLEFERLQTLPDNYTACVSDTQRYKALGNGWTAAVIIYLLGIALKDVPRDEKIVVLSMYDGIATGRYCLDKLGFTNVEYHAFEIDTYAIRIAQTNYPDIVQHGNAFAVRDKEWQMFSDEFEFLIKE